MPQRPESVKKTSKNITPNIQNTRIQNTKNSKHLNFKRPKCQNTQSVRNKENRIYIRVKFSQSLGMNFVSPFQPEREFKVYKSCKCSQIYALELSTINFKISPCNVVFNLNPPSETPNQINFAPFSLFSGNEV